MVLAVSPAIASSDENATSYDATYEADAGSTSQTLAEKLTIRRGDPQAFLSLTSSGGAKFAAPTTFAKDGEIETISTDPSVTCYNMAAATLYQKAHDPNQPGFLYIRAGGGLAKIPLTVTEARGRDGAEIYAGTGKQILEASTDGSETVPVELSVEAQIRVMGDVITDATFGEVTAAGSASNVISRQACALKSAESAGTRSLT